MIHVTVLQSDIDAGQRECCHSCPVALAISRVTGDNNASVSSIDWNLHVTVWSRSIPAPYRVRQFVMDFDDEEPVAPFDFDLPDQSDPSWKESCGDCGQLFDGSELDDEGCCEDCACATKGDPHDRS